MRKIIINADDYGQSVSCTDAIAYCLENGLITDTTMVANGDAFNRAVQLIQEKHFHKRIGIHFVLTEGFPMTDAMRNNSKFTNPDGSFRHFFRTKRAYFTHLSKQDKKCIYEELSAQLKRISATGIHITHADSHHHVHFNFKVLRIVIKVCKENNIYKIRSYKNAKKRGLFHRLYGCFFKWFLKINGMKTTDFFGNISEYSKIGDGVSELMLHPDYSTDMVLIDRRSKAVQGGKVQPVGQDIRQVLMLAEFGDDIELFSYDEL